MLCLLGFKDHYPTVQPLILNLVKDCTNIKSKILTELNLIDFTIDFQLDYYLATVLNKFHLINFTIMAYKRVQVLVDSKVVVRLLV